MIVNYLLIYVCASAIVCKKNSPTLYKVALLANMQIFEILEVFEYSIESTDRLIDFESIKLGLNKPPVTDEQIRLHLS